MATRVLKVCDVCGTPTEEDTLRFGWLMSNYEIDLCSKHQEEVSSVMETAVSKARRLGAPALGVNLPPKPLSPRDQVPTTEVRAWAKANGIEVSDRGRVPDEIFEMYLSRNQS